MLDWRRKQRERDLERELRDHLELEAAEQDSSLSPAEAHNAARRALGNTTLVSEEVREMWGWGWLERFGRDVRYALRTLRGNPGFAAVTVLALALGSGANTAIYSIVNAVYLRMLPVERPQDLVTVATRFVLRGEVRANESFSYPQLQNLRAGSRTLQGVMAHHIMDFSVATRETTSRVRGALVSGNYFSLLGVRPVIGTAIEPSDDVTPRSGGARGPVAVLGYAYWMERFGGDPAVIGRKVDLNGNPFTIVGVAPPGFVGTVVGERLEVFAPLMAEPVLWPENPALDARRNVWLRIMGRLNPGVSVAAAEAELTVLFQQFNQVDLAQAGLSEARRRTLREQRAMLLPGSTGTSGLRRQLATALSVVAVIAGLVLLIACANVANLLLTRAHGRRREIAVRLALGASRGRLMSQLLTESVVLALAGSLAGILLARWVRDLLLRFLPQMAGIDTAFDRHVLAFNLTLALVTGLLFGLAPALQSTKADLANAIRAAGSSAGSLKFRFGRALLIAQVALSLLLLTGAGLFRRSLGNLEAIDLGFTQRNVLTFAADPKLIGYTSEQSHAFFDRLMERVRGLPGVISAARADFAPLGNHTGHDVYVEGYRGVSSEPSSSPGFGAISPGYFETLGVSLLAGRTFDSRDDAAGQKVAIVNEAFARHYLAGKNPIGRLFGSEKDRYDTTIVGVMRDGRYSGLRDDGQFMVYVPASQVGSFFDARVVHLRTVGDPAALTSAVRDLVREIDPRVPVFNVATVAQHIDRALTQDKLVATLSGIFSALALGLAAVGLYGAMSYWVSRRIREIGIRVALGATRGGILAQVIGEALRLLALGALLGLPASYAAVKLVGSMLYGVEPADPASAGLALAVLAAATVIAVWVPARRAAAVDPMTALRYE